MAVLITALVPGQTQEGYDQAMNALRPLLDRAHGFIAHGAGMSPDGWRVFEVWESQEQATAFFAQHIHPHLPPGVTPKRTYLDLHALVVAPVAAQSRS
jgi:heme-degrading monooxygenase HmoA